MVFKNTIYKHGKGHSGSCQNSRAGQEVSSGLEAAPVFLKGDSRYGYMCCCIELQ